MNGHGQGQRQRNDTAYSAMGNPNVNYSNMMNRVRTATPAYQGVPYGSMPQRPDYDGENIQPYYQPPPPQQPRYQQPPPQFQGGYPPQQQGYPPQQMGFPQPPQPRYQPQMPMNDGYQTQGYYQGEEQQMRRPPQGKKDDMSGTFEVPDKKKNKDNGGYYDFSSNNQFLMKS